MYTLYNDFVPFFHNCFSVLLYKLLLCTICTFDIVLCHEPIYWGIELYKSYYYYTTFFKGTSLLQMDLSKRVGQQKHRHTAAVTQKQISTELFMVVQRFYYFFFVLFSLWHIQNDCTLDTVLTRQQVCTRLYKNHVDFVQQAASRKNKLYKTWLAYWCSWSLPFQRWTGTTHKMINTNAQQEINRQGCYNIIHIYTLYYYSHIQILPRNTSWNLPIWS